MSEAPGRNRAFEQLVDPADDGRAAGEIAQALQVRMVRVGHFGRVTRRLAVGAVAVRRQPVVDFAADADSGPNAHASLEARQR